MKLSIITINLNNAEDLQRTIDSVQSQTFTDYEFIIIDGGSTDGSVEIIKGIESRLSFWISERDKGIFNAMNKGIVKANGTYLLMLNAGDVLYNNETLKKVFEPNPTEEVLYGDVILESKGKIFGNKIFSHPITFGFFRKTSISHQGAFIKKELHDKIGLYDETLKFSSDWKFFVLAFCKYDVSTRYINQFIAVCNCDGLTWNPKYFPAIRLEMADVLQTYFPAFVLDYNNFDKLEKKPFFKTTYFKFKQFVKKLIGRTAVNK